MLRIDSGVVALLVIAAFSGYAAEAQNGQQSGPDGALGTLKVQSSTVVEDVVVTDRRGHPITGLRKDDFQIYENGKPQNITFFEPHFPSVSTAQPAPTLSPNTFSNITAFQQDETTNILLLDGLNTASADQMYARRQMLKYLDSLPSGLRIGVFLLGDRLRLLQGFTQDSSLLHASIEKLSNKPLSVALESTPDELASQSNALNDLNTMTQGPGGGQLAEMISDLQGFLAKSTEVQQNQQLLMTLDALRSIARYVSAVPGHKNLIWFVGSFPLCQLGPTASKTECPYEDQVERTINELSAARVSLYPVDAGGVSAPNADVGGSGFDQTTGLIPGTSAPIYGTSGPSGSAFVAASIDPYFRFIASENWAEATGGKAAHNNDLAGAVQEVVRNGTRYYTLAYVPSIREELGRERKIKVVVLTGNYKLAYRRSYFERTAQEVKAGEIAANQDPLRPLMDHGMPNSTQIPYQIRISQPAEQLSPDKSQTRVQLPLQGKGKDVQIDVSFLLQTDSLSLIQEADGTRRRTLEVALVVYDHYGQTLNWAVSDVNLLIKPNQWPKVKKAGVPFYFQISAPAGSAYLRTGVYDRLQQKAGTLEIPFNDVTLTKN
jgi:VWFA-related protein